MGARSILGRCGGTRSLIEFLLRRLVDCTREFGIRAVDSVLICGRTMKGGLVDCTDGSAYRFQLNLRAIFCVPKLGFAAFPIVPGI